MNFIFRFFIQLITCKSLKWYKPLMKIDIKILPDNVNLVKCSPCQDNLIWWQNNLELGVWWYFVIPVSYFQIIIKYFLAFIFLFVFGISWFWLWSRKQFASPWLHPVQLCINPSYQINLPNWSKPIKKEVEYFKLLKKISIKLLGIYTAPIG